MTDRVDAREPEESVGSFSPSEVERVGRWIIEVKDGRAIRWRPVTIIEDDYFAPVVETIDGRRLRVFRSSLHFQPNAHTDLPVESAGTRRTPA